MKTQITITVLPDQEQNSKIINSKITAEIKKSPAAKELEKNSGKFEAVFIKKSIDARHGQVKLHLRYNVFIGENAKAAAEDKVPEWKKADGKKSVIIVGSGPAGLFAALKLLEKGIKPVILERGEETSQRKRDIAQISTKDNVNPDSNYCF